MSSNTSATMLLMGHSMYQSKFSTDVQLSKDYFSNIRLKPDDTRILNVTLKGNNQPITGKLVFSSNTLEAFSEVVEICLSFTLLSGQIHSNIINVQVIEKSRLNEIMSFKLKNSKKNVKNFDSINTFVYLLDNQSETSGDYEDYSIEFIMPLNTDNFLKKLNTRKYLLESGKCSDFQIIVNNEKTFKVHSFILGESSTIFKEMIDGGLAEKKAVSLCINDFISPENFYELLKFIYDDTVDLHKGVHEIFKAAHRYKIDDLIVCCKKFLISNIHNVDIVETLKLTFVDSYELYDVLAVANKFIKDNEEKLIKNKDFLQFFIDTMDAKNFQYIFDISMRYQLDNFKEIVKKFIMDNQTSVLENQVYRKLLMKHPEWAIELFTFFAQSGKTAKDQ